MEIAVLSIVVLITVFILIWINSLSKKSERADKKMDDIENYLEKIQDLKKNKNISGVPMLS